MKHHAERPTAGRLLRHPVGVRRLVGFVALMTVVLFSTVSPAAATAPLKVCSTCTYTDLPAAIAAAAAQSGDDKIQIASGIYSNSMISTNVTLLGAGAEVTTIGRVRVEAGVSVTIKNVTVSGPGFSVLFGDYSGIANAGTLTLKDSVVTGNELEAGAGIANASTGTMIVQGSTIARNNAWEASGGGIVNAGTMTLRNSTVSENFAFSSSGGIFNSGTLILRDSTVTENRTIGGGGGIGNDGTLTLRGSTVSTNESDQFRGGGIDNDGTLSVRQSNVTGNSAATVGGGIYNGQAGAVTLTESTVSANTAPVGPGIFNDGGTLTIRDSMIQP